MEKLKQYFKNDRYAALAGMELVELSEGYAKTRVEIADCHLNPMDIAHGGLTFTLADFALAAAANSHGHTAVLLNAAITYTKPARKGDILTAEAREVSASKRTAACAIRVNNQNGDLVAIFQGTVFKRGDPFPPLPAP